MNNIVVNSHKSPLIAVGNYPINGADLTNILSGCLIPFYNKERPRSILSGLRNEMGRMKKQMQSDELTNESLFPVEVFPSSIERLVHAGKKYLGFPIEYFCASILYALSVAIGNTYAIQVKRGWVEKAVLYLILIGKPGINKTHPLNFALAPIRQRDNEHYRQYKQQVGEYETLVSMSQKQRDVDSLQIPDKPKLSQILLSDYTPEAIAKTLEFNKRGIGVHIDEIAGWFKGFDRYHKGNEGEFWLSNWNIGDIRVNRKTADPVYITNPFISVAGTIQSGILHRLKQDDRADNGFLLRILFVMPKNLTKAYPSEEDIDADLVDDWQDLIFRMLDVPLELDETMNAKPKVILFDKEAKTVFNDWHRTQIDKQNESESDLIKGLLSKYEMITPRFALILEIISRMCEGKLPESIGVESVKNAIKLADYFANQAVNVHMAMAKISPLESLDHNKRRFYDALPTEFRTAEALQISKGIGIPDRTANRFFANDKYFIHISQGIYKKRFE